MGIVEWMKKNFFDDDELQLLTWEALVGLLTLHIFLIFIILWLFEDEG